MFKKSLSRDSYKKSQNSILLILSIFERLHQKPVINRFIEALHKKFGRVAILIDEYDYSYFAYP